jgi:hypothetical protein
MPKVRRQKLPEALLRHLLTRRNNAKFPRNKLSCSPVGWTLILKCLKENGSKQFPA